MESGRQGGREGGQAGDVPALLSILTFIAARLYGNCECERERVCVWRTEVALNTGCTLTAAVASIGSVYVYKEPLSYILTGESVTGRDSGCHRRLYT